MNNVNKFKIIFFCLVFMTMFFNINQSKASPYISDQKLLKNPYLNTYYDYETGLKDGYVLGVKIAAISNVSNDPIIVSGTGLVNPDRGTGFDTSTYLTNSTRKDLLFNAGYQNGLTIPQNRARAVLAEKGLEVEGDLLTGDITFQGKKLYWSKPIRGKLILYYK